MRNRWAYYSRSDSYSRSYNAEQAESEGRFPKSRFRAEIRKAIGSRATPRLLRAYYKAGAAIIERGTNEWHHVGRYASRIDYFDFSKLIALGGRLSEATKEARQAPLRTTKTRQRATKLRKEERERKRQNLKAALSTKLNAFKARAKEFGEHRRVTNDRFQRHLFTLSPSQREAATEHARTVRYDRKMSHK
jgi:hypothetical protein